ncbi:MAG TPA: hypothetical protein VMV49_08855 [Candidatus Deferrimicrobium sp.]|nr:hypothetical protein [Candidatus Deferrimicrobium sp.]
MEKFNFRKVFKWMSWLTLVILGGWIGLFLIDMLHMGTRNVALLVIFLLLTLFTFAVDSLMEENPEVVKKYFIQWLLVCGLFIFFALTIYTWAS